VPDSPSLAFDRAADYYDATRGLPADAKTEVTRLLVAELRQREPVLEVGVGTGRIGLSLADMGVEIIGVDLSEPMLRRLVEKAGGSLPFPLCRADAIHLPFAPSSFGAVVTCHVLHLVPAWEKAVAEFVRVILPGGVYLNDLGGWDRLAGPRVELMKRFGIEAGFELKARGANDVDEIDRAMALCGRRPRALPAVTFEESHTYEQTIIDLENGIWSYVWEIPDEVRRTAGAKLRRWAADRYGDLTRTYESRVSIEWRTYEVA
jgi:SAM-dependent methyltransferase